MLGGYMAFFIGTFYLCIQTYLSFALHNRSIFTSKCYQFIAGFRMLLCVLCFAGLIFNQIFSHMDDHSMPPHDDVHNPAYGDKTYFYLTSSGEWGFAVAFFTFVLTFVYEFQRIKIRIKLSGNFKPAVSNLFLYKVTFISILISL